MLSRLLNRINVLKRQLELNSTGVGGCPSEEYIRGYLSALKSINKFIESEGDSCYWTYDVDSECWFSGCLVRKIGKVYTGDYCCFCGKKIVENR